MSDPTVDDVEKLGTWQGLKREKKTALLNDAITETDQLYVNRQTTFPTLNGDRSIFIKNLAAHKWTLAEGGEAQSEGQTGGSVSYNTVTGEAQSNLQQTRYGREASQHIRDNQGLGIQRR